MGAPRRRYLVSALFLASFACSRGAREAQPSGPVTVVLEHQPLWGDPAAFHASLERFQRENPDIVVRTQTLPNASDVAREMFLTALEGGADDFDVFAIDVVWAPEFARAGWLADLTGAFPPSRLRAEYLASTVEAVTLDGRIHAVPWFLDVGLLYYRTDLVPRAPKTYAEMQSFARAALARDPALAGYLWLGRQYEGLNCNVFEVIWGHGGDLLRGGRIALDTEAARAGLAFLRDAIASGLSPRSVVASAEEETRRAFQDGRAVFL
ncbi:MAG: extracellular solute-binding protein, partial [Myxococcales bacterium]